jgi:hypothetical protein
MDPYGTHHGPDRPGSPTAEGVVSKTVFTVHEARAAGMTEHQLRDPRLISPTPGIRVWDGPDRPWTESVQAISSLPGDHYLSHTTAARLWGIWLPPGWDQDWPLHVTGRKGATGARRRPGITGHRAALDDIDVVDSGMFRLTSPERTWLDLATLVRDHDALVAAGDALLQRRDGPPRPPGVLGSNPLSSFAAIDAVLGRRRRTKGINAARYARTCLRPGVDSAPETKIRMIIIGAGLPEPVVNEQVWLSPTVRRRPDLHYAQWRIAIQYDGRGHEETGQLNSDIHRDDDFSVHGWVTVRAASDIYTRKGQSLFLERLRRAIAHRQQVRSTA